MNIMIVIFYHYYFIQNLVAYSEQHMTYYQWNLILIVYFLFLFIFEFMSLYIRQAEIMLF
jgi:hypothetical protein